jgi:hypothetical protein
MSVLLKFSMEIMDFHVGMMNISLPDHVENFVRRQLDMG